MARRSAAGGTPATVALTQAGVAFTLHPYEHDPRAESFGLEAATALGVEPARVFKTLLAAVDGAAGSARRGELVVGIVPVSGHLDLKALARAVGGSRGAMAEVAAAERATGYVAGGISPVGQRRRHRTVLDASALDFPTIFVSAGRRGLDLEIAPGDLLEVTGATTAAIGR
jgi:Cys-tRNA(Pro)/Cys-tRNA(Cys) deacylase